MRPASFDGQLMSFFSAKRTRGRFIPKADTDELIKGDC